MGAEVGVSKIDILLLFHKNMNIYCPGFIKLLVFFFMGYHTATGTMLSVLGYPAEKKRVASSVTVYLEKPLS